MPDHPTARVLRGDGGQDYAVLTLSGVTVTVYRALDATPTPTAPTNSPSTPTTPPSTSRLHHTDRVWVASPGRPPPPHPGALVTLLSVRRVMLVGADGHSPDLFYAGEPFAWGGGRGD